MKEVQLNVVTDEEITSLIQCIGICLTQVRAQVTSRYLADVVCS